MKNLKKYGRTLRVRDDGAIFSEDYVTPTGRRVKARKLQTRPNNKGYQQINIMTDEGRKFLLQHRIVAEAFFENYSKDLEVDHIDGNPSNNHPSNLRMATHVENLRAHRTRSEGFFSLFRGVSKGFNGYKYRVYCNNKWVGQYNDEIEAAKAWNKKALEEGYDTSVLNIIPNEG